jgi:type II secretory pathway component GspD/PulD (secretin)
MRRFIFTLLSITTAFIASTSSLQAQQDSRPRLQKLPVPAAQTKSIATKLSLQYQDIPGVKIAPDVRNEELVVMAPEAAQRAIAKDVQAMLASHVRPTRNSGPLNIGLTYITWREFEDSLQRLAGGPLPVTTSRNGERAAFQLTAAPMQGTTVEVDRRNNSVTVVAPQPSVPGWKKMIAMLDQVAARGGDVTELMRLENAEPAPIQRALRLLKELESGQGETVVATPLPINSPFRNAVFQQNAAGGQVGEPPAGQAPAEDGMAEEAGAGVIGDTQIQFVPELGTIIIRGAKRDVQRVMDVIQQIEEQSKITKPDVEVIELKHTDANAVSALLQQLYEDVLSARQGEVSITSLDSPNALLLIGRTEAIDGLKELIEKIDQPVAESSRLRVFRLQNASAIDAEQTIRDFFTDRPGTGDDPRPGVGPRVRVLADYRTNSLIISAAPRDMIEVTRLINDLDVHEITAQNEIKVFPLNNAIAEELAPVLQSAINGEGEGVGNDNITANSTALSIVAVDSDGNKVVDSGILAGAVVTADAGANAIVVRAPAASMALVAELIRQLDKAPGIDSLVKVFTVENGDAAQLTVALQELFGADAGTLGTSVGAANAAGLPSSTASGESSLVPLRFSTDIRTNSIIASGSAEDLEVVESILLRLDSEGFAERITEVIWLRHATASNVATAITSYVQQRTQTVNTIQQFQQGLGPYDLPDRDLIVVAEDVSNSLVLSVSPRLYEDVRRMIDKLDRRPPMVLIKVVLAEIRLDDTFEIGGEVGLQDSLLYDRGIAAGAFPEATAPSNPGFGFNNNGTPNLNSFGQGNVAASGLSSFGVGTSNSTLGYGGFVLSAASDSVSLLLRTLQDAGRGQILSRPQIMTMDNTDGYVQVGRQIARVTGVESTGTGAVAGGIQVATEDIEIGLILQVRPRVGADGLIVMDIDATRSDRDTSSGTQVPTGNAITPILVIDDIIRTTAQSTIAAYSGQTVVFGGLIQKVRVDFSRRVPIVADIPLLGHFFKYDQEAEQRTETLVIMTPMLINGDEDLDYVKEVESSRMSWCLADVVEMHGDVGLSGGYGLWGPAVGNTIYPDLQPTIENVIIQDSYPTESPLMGEEEIPGSNWQPGSSSDMIIGPGPTSNSSGGVAPTQSPAIGAPANGAPAIGAPVRPITTDSQPVPSSPNIGSLPQGGNQQSPLDLTGGVQVEAIPQTGSNAARNLPASVTIPSSFLMPNSAGTKVKPSVYPIPPKGPAATKQASWIDVLSRSTSQQDEAADASSTVPRQKPIRLGSGDKMLTSD